MEYQFKDSDNRKEDCIDIYLYDTPDEIQMCLNCTKPECTNCLCYKEGKYL